MADRRRIVVDVSEEAVAWLLRQVETGGFDTAGEFIRHLIRKAMDQETIDRIDARLAASEASGPGKEMAAKDWKDLLRRAQAGVHSLKA
jgi:Arc/MetJ-type ribon-helix-helix transcriptional regulator